MKPKECRYRLWVFDRGAFGCYIPGGNQTVITSCTEQNSAAVVCSDMCPEQRNENSLKQQNETKIENGSLIHIVYNNVDIELPLDSDDIDKSFQTILGALRTAFGQQEVNGRIIDSVDVIFWKSSTAKMDSGELPKGMLWMNREIVTPQEALAANCSCELVLGGMDNLK